MPPAQNRFIFLTSFSYPTHHAHPTHGLEMARAWAERLGGSFTFVIQGTTDPELLHGIQYQTAFGQWGNIVKALHLRTVAYFFWLLAFCLRNKSAERPIMFVNDIRIGIVAALLRRVFAITFIFESHGIYSAFAERMIYPSADNVIFVTEALRKRAVGSYKPLADKSTCIPNAVDISRYDSVEVSQEQLRTELSLPSGMLIGYVGRFNPGSIDKGVGFMLRALPALPDTHKMLFVGGTNEEIQEMEKFASELGVASRAIFVPFVEASLVPRYCKACDILAYVPSEVASPFHQVETSPMKLFEYMAAQRPIVVSDTPVVREVLDETCAYFIVPGSEASFLAAIHSAGSDIKKDAKIGMAYQRVRSNTWTRRAERVLSFLNG